MIDLVYYLKKLLFFDIPLYYYINLSSLTIYYLFSGDIYLSSYSLCNTFVILSVILLLVKSPVAVKIAPKMD